MNLTAIVVGMESHHAAGRDTNIGRNSNRLTIEGDAEALMDMFS